VMTPPVIEMPWPTNRRRKSREVRRGVRSITSPRSAPRAASAPRCNRASGTGSTTARDGSGTAGACRSGSRPGVSVTGARYPEPVQSGIAAAGVPALFGAITVIEAGIPLPIPGDVLMLLVGERAAANAIPLWLAVLGLEAVVAVGTSALFFAARGPLRALIASQGHRVGLTPERLERASSALEHRGQVAIAVGRCTPSLRTLTVIATASSRLTAKRALFWLLLGGSIFIQLHLVLGYLVGPVAESAFQRAAVPSLIVVCVLILAAAVYWIVRHGGRAGLHAWSESTGLASVLLHLVPHRLRLNHHEIRGTG
jgi:membrane protein DedA with SNARE-associated domain